MERKMGVFTKSMIALLVFAPWLARSEERPEETETERVRNYGRPAIATRMTGWHQYPSTSVLRADLEAFRRRP
jgi:hypothetical protein